MRVYNIKNRLKPYLIRDIRIEGRYFNGRKTQDGFMYLLSIQNLYQRVKPYPWYSIGYSRNYAKLGSIFLYEGDYYRPIFVNIFSFDLKNPFKRNNHNLACIITENAQVLYMSENYIYLTYQDYRNGYKDYTVIHKVFVWKKFIIPFADGLVRGRVNNQFSLDEHNDVLRIATTSNNPRASNVFCLDYYLE